MTGVRAGGRLSARAQNPGRLRLPEKTSPRLRRRSLSSPFSVAEVCNARIIHSSFLENVAGADLSKWNIASFSKDEQDKVSVDKAAAAVAWQERMNKPVVHELVEREQPEHLREYFRERLRVHRLNSQQLPRANAPEYQKPEDGGSESKP
jgi:DNA polymerase-3 subunit theta